MYSRTHIQLYIYYKHNYLFECTGHSLSQQDLPACGQDVKTLTLPPWPPCQGYNVCMFAYGQTGSGKTFSMQGSAPTSQKIRSFCWQARKTLLITLTDSGEPFFLKLTVCCDHKCSRSPHRFRVKSQLSANLQGQSGRLHAHLQGTFQGRKWQFLLHPKR